MAHFGLNIPIENRLYCHSTLVHKMNNKFVLALMTIAHSSGLGTIRLSYSGNAYAEVSTDQLNLQEQSSKQTSLCAPTNFTTFSSNNFSGLSQSIDGNNALSQRSVKDVN
jgi:hypothetical protein